MLMWFGGTLRLRCEDCGSTPEKANWAPGAGAQFVCGGATLRGEGEWPRWTRPPGGWRCAPWFSSENRLRGQSTWRQLHGLKPRLAYSRLATVICSALLALWGYLANCWPFTERQVARLNCRPP